MAKEPTTGVFTKAPWAMSEKAFEEFTLVTEKNKKEVLVKGRVLYNIFVDGKFKQYRSFFEFRPILKKGRWTIANHPIFKSYPAVWVSEGESFETYQERFLPIKMLMEQKQLYFREKDSIIQYTIA